MIVLVYKSLIDCFGVGFFLCGFFGFGLLFGFF